MRRVDVREQAAGRSEGLRISDNEGAEGRWGGRRAGAGRKSAGARAGVPHKRRAPVRPEYPRHVTVSLSTRLLRKQVVFEAVCEVLRAVKRLRSESFRINEFSIQSDHIHMMVEAESNSGLSNGMKSLNARLVRCINAILRRHGSLFRDRFHDRELTSARAVKLVLAYIFANFRKHGTLEAELGLAMDPYSSAAYFQGFAAADFTMFWGERLPPEETLPTSRARGELLSNGWKREGLLSIGYCPPRHAVS